VKFIETASLPMMRGGIELLSARKAIQVIFECKLNKIPVLGIDAFIITSERTQPFLEYSRDTSICAKSCYEDLIQFLRNISNEELVFEIVVGDLP
jgi:hypothetical protein